MAESSVQVAEHKTALREFSSELSNGSSSLFQRRIEFHPARRPYKGFGKNGCGGGGGGDFRIETLNPSASSDPVRTGFGSGQPKKSDASEVSDGGLDPELSFGITFRTIGAGLENRGNTCYLNSVLQCLTYTEPLAAYLQSGKHKNTCRIAGFCALCAIQKHVSRALQSTGRCLSPDDLVANLKCISRNFRSWRQEDAHEYMVNLLESMHKCCLPSGVPSESPSAYEKSLVHKIFGGSLRSQVKCLQCSFCSNKYDPFLDLSLEINKADSVDKALSHFTAAELLDGGERQYQCQRCKQKVRARKQLTVHKPPYVLTIHLKRFRAHDPGQKIDKKVNFGPTLDLRPFLSDSQGDVKYTLYGVLVHSGGSTRSGHYYCFVRTSSGIWHSLDDNRVSPVSEKRVLEQKAYMLFYVRDRSNIVPRKPSNVALKENIKANERGTNVSSALNQVLKKPVQNGSIEVRSSSVASAAVVQKDVLSAVLSGKPISNERLNQPKSEQSIMTSQLKDPSERLPPPKTPGQCLKTTEPPSNNSVSSNLGIGAATNATNVNELNEKGSSDKNSSVSVVGSSKFEEIQSSESAKIVINRSSTENNPASLVKVSRTNSSKEAIVVSSEKMDSVKQPDQTSHEQSQIGTMTNRATDDPLDKETSSNSQNLVHGNSSILPGSSAITTDSIPGEASDCKSHKKLKKKILRRQVANLNFGSSFLIRASLAVRKRKKHKRSKRRPLGPKNLIKELLVDSNSSSSDSGPSTSEKTHIICSTPIHSQTTEAKSSSKIEANGTAPKEKTSSSDSLKNVVDGGFRERNGQNRSVLSQDEQLQNFPGVKLPVKQHYGGESGSPQDCKRERMGNGWMGTLSRGLEETVVARWDDVEPPYENGESRAAESVSIGYVADEWDEEYDRGKRKKVKQAKIEFGGQNPFQKIASNKLMSKKAKIEKARSGNQPFRI